MSATVIEIIGQQGPQGPQGPGPDFVDANITTTGTLLAGAGSVITGNSSTSALRVTQEGSGNALLIEDDVHPDNTPLVVNNVGQIISGATTAFFDNASLQITADTSSAPNANIIIRRCSSNDNSPAFIAAKARGTGASLEPVQPNDNIARLQFMGYTGVGLSSTAAVASLVDGAVSPTAGGTPGRLVFSTTPVGAVSNLGYVERMRIDSAGNVGIGTSSPSSKLHIDGDLTLSSATTATTATAGSNGDVPAQVAGYLAVSINGTPCKIPYYAA